MTEKLQQTIQAIRPLDAEMVEKVRNHQDQLTKPQGALGRLEDLSIQLAGITGQFTPDFRRKAAVIFAADHGVTAENISAYPQVVTQQMVRNFSNGGAASSVFARQVGAELKVVDIGVAGDVSFPGVWVKKVKWGTDNFCVGPAMSKEEAIQALEVGIEVAETLIEEGFQIFATGEKGIGNTTASSAIVSVLTGCSIEEAVGPGTGLNHVGIQRKVNAVRKGILLNQPDEKNGLDVLSKVGGLDLAGMAGLMLGAAANRVPVIIDGFISTAAALVALNLAPASMHYMIPSHCSAEPAHRRSLEKLGLTPLFDLKMRLGEATGSMLSFQLVDLAVRVVKEMATFESGGVSEKII